MASGRNVNGRIGKTLAWAFPPRLWGWLLIATALCHSVDRVLAISVLSGALAFVLPHCWYTWYVLGSLGEKASPQRIYTRFRRGEMNKIGLVALSCALAFVTVRPLNDAGFFLAFLAMMVLSWANAARLAYVTDQV